MIFKKKQNLIKKIVQHNNFKLFIAGALSALAFAPLYLFPLLFLSFFYLLISIEEKKLSKKQTFLKGWFFGFGHFVIGLYWICGSLLIEPLKYAWLVPFALILIPGAAAVYIGLVTLSLNTIKEKFKIKDKFYIVLIFAIIWVIFEFLRTKLVSGFPWNLIGYVWCFSDIMIQTAFIFKIYGLSFLAIFIFSAFYVFTKKEKKNFKFIKLDKTYKSYLAIYILVFLGVIFYGYFQLSNKKEVKLNSTFRLVQPSIEQKFKLNSGEKVNIILKHLELSKINNDKVDYIIWPESAIPFILQENSTLVVELSKSLQNKILITGGLRGQIKNNQIQKIWNSLFAIQNSTITDFYDKHHLVPFGEYIPFSQFLPSFIKNMTYGNLDFSRGQKDTIISVNNLKIKPLICYEIIFPALAKSKQDYDLIVNITNDAWFGNTSGPYQHLDAAKLRAVENRKPVLRVANSGITVVINPHGQIIDKIKLNKKGYLDIEL